MLEKTLKKDSSKIDYVSNFISGFVGGVVHNYIVSKHGSNIGLTALLGTASLVGFGFPVVDRFLKKYSWKKGFRESPYVVAGYLAGVTFTSFLDYLD